MDHGPEALPASLVFTKVEMTRGSLYRGMGSLYDKKHDPKCEFGEEDDFNSILKLIR